MAADLRAHEGLIAQEQLAPSFAQLAVKALDQRACRISVWS
jgi:hypothetical protein